MEINSEFYKTDLGGKVSSVINTTSKMLIDRCYELIPADNIKTDLTDGWISSMDEMLDHYSAKLLPWMPNVGKYPSIIVETVDGFVVDAPLFHEENGMAVEGDIHMIFDFGYNGSVSFNGIHYQAKQMKGLRKFHFIITPYELETILDGYHCHTVGFQNNYELNKNEFTEKYRLFYDKLISGFKFERKKIGKSNYTDELLRFLPISLTDDISGNGETAVLDFFTLFLDKNRRLVTYITYSQYPENIAGLELYYQGEIEKIKERIKKISSNLKINIDEKEYRTGIKISRKAKEEIKEIYFMRNNKCIIT